MGFEPSTDLDSYEEGRKKIGFDQSTDLAKTNKKKEKKVISAPLVNRLRDSQSKARKTRFHIIIIISNFRCKARKKILSMVIQSYTYF